jgi:hypothetical protein
LTTAPTPAPNTISQQAPAATIIKEPVYMMLTDPYTGTSLFQSRLLNIAHLLVMMISSAILLLTLNRLLVVLWPNVRWLYGIERIHLTGKSCKYDISSTPSPWSLSLLL